MILGVAGRLEHVHLQDACVKDIAVVDRTSLERHDLPSLYGVRRTGPLDQLQAAGDVVVVQVRFHDEDAIPPSASRTCSTWSRSRWGSMTTASLPDPPSPTT